MDGYKEMTYYKENRQYELVFKKGKDQTSGKLAAAGGWV